MPLPDLSVPLPPTCCCPPLFSFLISLILVTLHFVHIFTFLPSVPKTRVKPNIRREKERHYHLKYVWAFIKIHHSEKNLIGECAGVSPGVRQDLVLLVGLSVKQRARRCVTLSATLRSGRGATHAPHLAPLFVQTQQQLLLSPQSQAVVISTWNLTRKPAARDLLVHTKTRTGGPSFLCQGTRNQLTSTREKILFTDLCHLWINLWKP